MSLQPLNVAVGELRCHMERRHATAANIAALTLQSDRADFVNFVASMLGPNVNATVSYRLRRGADIELNINGMALAEWAGAPESIPDARTADAAVTIPGDANNPEQTDAIINRRPACPSPSAPRLPHDCRDCRASPPSQPGLRPRPPSPRNGLYCDRDRRGNPRISVTAARKGKSGGGRPLKTLTGHHRNLACPYLSGILYDHTRRHLAFDAESLPREYRTTSADAALQMLLLMDAVRSAPDYWKAQAQALMHA